MNALVQYNNQEWALINGVMDRVDQIRASTPLDLVDLDKVQSLVLRTYEEQNISVSPALVAQVCRAMAHPSTQPAGSKDSLMARSGGPMAKAAAAVKRVQNHQPMTTIALMKALESKLKHEKRLKRRMFGKVGIALLATPAIGAAVIALGWGAMNVVGAVFSIVGCLFAIPAVAGLVVAFDSSMATDKLEKLEQITGEALEGLEQDKSFCYSLSKATQELLGVPYSTKLLSDSTYRWKETNKSAMEDPALRQAWTAWLQSDSPIREGDVDLINQAAEAIQEARRVMAIYDPAHGMVTQAHGRGHALKEMIA